MWKMKDECKREWTQGREGRERHRKKLRKRETERRSNTGRGREGENMNICFQSTNSWNPWKNGS